MRKMLVTIAAVMFALTADAWAAKKMNDRLAR